MIETNWIIAVCFAMWLGSAVTLAAQDERADETDVKQAALDANGIWIWKREGDRAGGMRFTLRLTHRDGRLTGTLARRLGDRELRPEEIEEAKLNRNVISFAVNNGQLHYVGTLSNQTIDGWVWALMGTSVFEREWQAKRGLEWVDVLGEWKLVALAPNGGDNDWILNLTKDGDNVRGTVTSEPFGEIKAFDIDVKDAQLTFAAVRKENGHEISVKFTLERRGDALKGNLQFGDDSDSVIELTGERVIDSTQDVGDGESQE